MGSGWSGRIFSSQQDIDVAVLRTAALPEENFRS